MDDDYKYFSNPRLEMAPEDYAPDPDPEYDREPEEEEDEDPFPLDWRDLL
jgi:hypothetical protein